MKRNTWLPISIIVALVLIAGATPAMADDFYKGKTIRFIVGFAAGGGFDTYSRIIARHIGKHIPGNPDTIVENMTGAGSLIAANYIYNKADPDGLTIGNFIGPRCCKTRSVTRPRNSTAESSVGWAFPPPTPAYAC